MEALYFLWLHKPDYDKITMKKDKMWYKVYCRWQAILLLELSFKLIILRGPLKIQKELKMRTSGRKTKTIQLGK